jgi:hypothetical protein
MRHQITASYPKRLSSPKNTRTDLTTMRAPETVGSAVALIGFETGAYLTLVS